MDDQLLELMSASSTFVFVDGHSETGIYNLDLNLDSRSQISGFSFEVLHVDQIAARDANVGLRDVRLRAA